ncbi:MAG: hypothetical protein K0R79_3408 [Stenotrophomonas indicatrix]|jgi:hypothetical protein|uniref:hypothetical protein n=1 Tax=Stenotrophomonas indicatrix TaxID=2045451 RepID=UPI002430EB9A|nr:hypothetical protein [Stenotrophomonas indicatrix]MDF2483051.1 hypothetical protein [Stenotrophomonas indicatrix]
MPDTGHFAIHAFEAALNISGDVERIISLTVSCRHCAEITCAQDANLLHLPGGTLFRCDACGCHQAISNARLSDWQLPPLLGV